MRTITVGVALLGALLVLLGSMGLVGADLVPGDNPAHEQGVGTDHDGHTPGQHGGGVHSGHAADGHHGAAGHGIDSLGEWLLG